jgi:predicted  nucleic acid-binding Zn-ribbon protein
MTGRIRLIGLSIQGSAVASGTVRFDPGLTTIYGASDTGKSLLVEAIDFMLGGGDAPRALPELERYSRIRMAIELPDRTVTLTRALEGGAFKLHDGVWLDEEPQGEGERLNPAHADGQKNNLSGFLLAELGLLGKRVRKNAAGKTNSLSFRNIARLVVVTQTEIIQERSPLSDGNPTADTTNTSTFRLLLTNRDDSDLESATRDANADVQRKAQVTLLRDLITNAEQRIRGISGTPNELDEQLDKLTATMEGLRQELKSKEGAFRAASAHRRKLFKDLSELGNRLTEVVALVERFQLLEQHYASDLARLDMIEQGGSLYVVMDEGRCSLCGAPPEAHAQDDPCEGNVERTVAAARAERAKILPRVTDLQETLSQLRSERSRLQGQVEARDAKLKVAETELAEIITPTVSTLRRQYSEFADKSASVRESLAVFETLEDLRTRKADLEREIEEAKPQSLSQRMPTTSINGFAKTVQSILTEWGFPGGRDVSFDTDKKDLLISGKERQAYGAGLRAVTQAAFTLGLLKYCVENNLPHPGFVVIDSALWSYKEPESAENSDVRTPEFKEHFFASVSNLAKSAQIIVVDNTEPPESIIAEPATIYFTGAQNHGRYGLLPLDNDPDDKLF